MEYSKDQENLPPPSVRAPAWRERAADNGKGVGVKKLYHTGNKNQKNLNSIKNCLKKN